jgi:hypothetical protein
MNAPTGLGALTDRLNEAFADVEDALEQLRLGVTASVEIGDGNSLAYKKFEGRSWSLVVMHADGSHTPVCHASRQLRVRCASAVDDLHAVLLETANCEAQAVATAIERLRVATERIRGSAALRGEPNDPEAQ